MIHSEPTVVTRQWTLGTGKPGGTPDQPGGLFGFLPLKDLLNVVATATDTTDKPASTTSCCADDVPGVESVDEGGEDGGGFMRAAVVFAPCEGEEV